MKVSRITRPLTLFAGIMDFGTGILLMTIPRLALNIMGVIPPAPDGLVYIRYIGAFVCAVGANYLLIIGARAPRIQTILAATAVLRGIVGGFVAIAVVSKMLSLQWAVVAIVDLTLAAIQCRIILEGE